MGIHRHIVLELRILYVLHIELKVTYFKCLKYSDYPDLSYSVLFNLQHVIFQNAILLNMFVFVDSVVSILFLSLSWFES